MYSLSWQLESVHLITLATHDSIKKLVLRIEENHPFDMDYFVTMGSRLGNLWKTNIETQFRPLCGRDLTTYNIATVWVKLTRWFDRIAKGLLKNSCPAKEEDQAESSKVMGRQTKQGDLTIPKRTKERRSRHSPQSVVPVAGGTSQQGGTTTRKAASAGRTTTTDPELQTP